MTVELPPKHRPIVLLAAALLAQILLLAFQVKRGGDVRLIRVWSIEMAAPVERAATWAVEGAGRSWHGYVDLRHAYTNNLALRAELERLRIANAQLEGKAAEDVRLEALLGFRQANASVPMIAARVIAASPDAVSHVVLINRGEVDGIRKNMGAITAEGVVGKIIRVYASTAQVLLINDPESGVGALLQGTRTHGVVRGQGGPELRMDYVISDEPVQHGEAVLTSGEDRIFPKDLPVGWITGAVPGNPFQVIRVRPAARLDRLEEVLVLMTRQELLSTVEKEKAAEEAPMPTSAPSANSAPATSAAATPAGASQGAAVGTRPKAAKNAPAAGTASPGVPAKVASGPRP